jgi:hypothetical protein
MSWRLDDCLKGRKDENVRRHCGHLRVVADEASRMRENVEAVPAAAMVARRI